MFSSKPFQFVSINFHLNVFFLKNLCASENAFSRGQKVNFKASENRDLVKFYWIIFILSFGTENTNRNFSNFTIQMKWMIPCIIHYFLYFVSTSAKNGFCSLKFEFWIFFNVLELFCGMSIQPIIWLQICIKSYERSILSPQKATFQCSTYIYIFMTLSWKDLEAPLYTSSDKVVLKLKNRSTYCL